MHNMHSGYPHGKPIVEGLSFEHGDNPKIAIAYTPEEFTRCAKMDQYNAAIFARPEEPKRNLRNIFNLTGVFLNNRDNCAGYRRNIRASGMEHDLNSYIRGLAHSELINPALARSDMILLFSELSGMSSALITILRGRLNHISLFKLEMHGDFNDTTMHTHCLPVLNCKWNHAGTVLEGPSRNHKVTVSEGDWLYFKPDVRHALSGGKYQGHQLVLLHP